MRTVWILVIAILGLGVIGCGKSEVVVNPKDGAEMVWVPAGEFTMGSTDKQTAAESKRWLKPSPQIIKVEYDAEKPQHKVFMDGYWMYKYEVTVAQYRKFCAATKREMPDPPSWGWEEKHPMVNVDWQDAAEYAKWAGVVLPTEAQWEKAARGTDGRIYPWGNDWDASKCASSDRTSLRRTQSVGSYPTGASPYGCMDMAGNVEEWCADWYDPNYYANAPTKNPTGPSGAVKFEALSRSYKGARVFRGGSWLVHSNDSCRCASRYSRYTPRRLDAPTAGNYLIGFRCAKTP